METYRLAELIEKIVVELDHVQTTALETEAALHHVLASQSTALSGQHKKSLQSFDFLIQHLTVLSGFLATIKPQVPASAYLEISGALEQVHLADVARRLAVDTEAYPATATGHSAKLIQLY